MGWVEKYSHWAAGGDASVDNLRRLGGGIFSKDEDGLIFVSSPVRFFRPHEGSFFCEAALVVSEAENCSSREDFNSVDLWKLEVDGIDETSDCDLRVDGRGMETPRTELASEISLFCRVLARWLFLFRPGEVLSPCSWCLASNFASSDNKLVWGIVSDLFIFSLYAWSTR